MTLMNPPRALALVGMPGAGKTLCALHLKQRGFYQFRFGKIITDEVENRGWAVNPDNERVVREEIRRNEGMDAIARRALPDLKAALDTHQTIVIDGLYGHTEYKTLHAELGAAMVVVAIFCPRPLRYQRLAARAERPLTPEQAQARDYQEIEMLEKGGPIAIADYTLINDNSEQSLLARLDSLLDELSIQP